VADFVIPELGENVAGGDVVRLMVKPGDTLAKDQPVLELETDKATIEVPSSVEGVVKELKVKQGDKVKVGQLVLTVEAGSGAAATPAAAKDASKAETPKAAPPKDESKKGEPDPRDPQKGGKPADPAEARHEDLAGAEPPPGEEADVTPSNVVDIGRSAPSRPAAAGGPVPSGGGLVPAAPSTRRTARELGVDITQVEGTGPGGRISVDDVKAYARGVLTGGGAPAARVASQPLPDFSQWGEVEVQPMRNIRRVTAERLSAGWAATPLVTQCDKADITELEKLRQRYAKQAEKAGGKLTITAIALKVIAGALKQFPQFNSSVDMAGQAIILKKYVHIGVAVDTDRGLMVPVIRDVDTKGIVQLSVELAQFAEKTKAGKLAPGDMQGGSFTISNLGGIGGTYFTPLVNSPEVAILGMSRAVMEPVWNGSAFEPRLMMPLSLSYDHRVIDGADGARFIRWVCEAFEQPFVLAL
jgi:pyruvate dehydrogenase E2 component (dihydrolipoamide acetyltransferase)